MAGEEASRRSGWISPFDMIVTRIRVDGEIPTDEWHRNWAALTLLYHPNDLLPVDESCVYELRDPDTDEVRYVGQTYKPKERYSGHCSYRGDLNPGLRDWVASLRDQGKRPKMVIVERFNYTPFPDDAPRRPFIDDVEKELTIAHIRRGTRLLNRNVGVGYQTIEDVQRRLRKIDGTDKHN